MMSVKEYAEDINRDVNLVLEKCALLDIDVKNEDDLLDEEAIIMLDNSFDEISEELSDEEIAEEVALEESSRDTKDSQSKKKKIKNVKKNDGKKSLAQKKKAMYKSKEKLQSNAPTHDENVILYKENMTISQLASAMGVAASEIIKKLFSLGLMVNINSAIS